MSFNDAAMASVKGNDYKVQFWYMSKLESINVLRNADLTKKKWNISKRKDLLPHIKMANEIKTTGDIGIEKHKFHRHRSPIFIEDVDIDDKLVSSNISSGEKIISTLLVTYIMIIKLSHYI